MDDWRGVRVGISLTKRGAAREGRSRDVKGRRARAQGFRKFQVRGAVGAASLREG